jgi:hypothetical protein
MIRRPTHRVPKIGRHRVGDFCCRVRPQRCLRLIVHPAAGAVKDGGSDESKADGAASSDSESGDEDGKSKQGKAHHLGQ